MNMNIIGIDLGSTMTKVVQIKNNNLTNKEIYSEKNVEKVIEKFINDNNIDLTEIEEFVITGVGASKIKKNIYNKPTKIVNEFEAIANCVDKNCLITSIGTGTAFILKNGEDAVHLGGSGLGGGTLINLAKKLTNIDNFNNIKELILKGNLNSVDLRLKDITKEKLSNLSMDTTVSNFGKIEPNANKADILKGILNIIIESIAVMCEMALKNTKIKEVVVIGTITTLPLIKDILKRVSLLHDVSFEIPENSQFLTAIGAVRKEFISLENHQI